MYTWCVDSVFVKYYSPILQANSEAICLVHPHCPYIGYHPPLLMRDLYLLQHSALDPKSRNSNVEATRNLATIMSPDTFSDNISIIMVFLLLLRCYICTRKAKMSICVCNDSQQYTISSRQTKKSYITTSICIWARLSYTNHIARNYIASGVS